MSLPPTDHNGLVRLGSAKICLRIVGLLLSVFFTSGCRSLQLPTIDPEGRCLFLPLTNTTQLSVPPLHSRPGEPGFLPDPAYREPSPPPNCVGQNCEPGGFCNLFHRKHDCLHKIHDHFRSSGKLGELQMTPLRVVAPVGGEVVLLAGICGEDGYLVRREPIEWMIAPDSVGQIIEVNDDAPGKLSSLLHPHRPKVEKLGVDFAKGRTSGKAQVIDRGTQNCVDDIHLRDGETFVSVSSPTEGITRVTALAPDSKIWDRRRQTAVIYWLDAKWDLPPPQILKAENLATFQTKVTKSEGLKPAAGWIVDYTIVEPTIATFVGRPDMQQIDERTVRTFVDNNGYATVQVKSVPGAMGTTPILIDVKCPAQLNENIPELPVFRGQTFVTFSAAGLQLQVIGPDVITRGEMANYSISMANPGDLDADNAAVRMEIPPNIKLLEFSKRPSTLTDTYAVWEQGILPANRQLDINITAQAVATGVFDVQFRAQANGINPVIKTIRTEVADASIEVRFAPRNNVSQAAVGDTVLYEIDVSNTGRRTVSNLDVRVASSPGLAEASSGLRDVMRRIPILPPGETQKIDVLFRVQQEGQHTVQLQLISNRNVMLERTANILGQPPRERRSNMSVELSFPAEENQRKVLRVGELADAVITLRNSGETTISNPNVQVSIDNGALEFIGINSENVPMTPTRQGNLILWTPPNLLPGTSGDTLRFLRLRVEAKQAVPLSSIRVVARSGEGLESTASAQVEVIDPRATSPGSNPVFPTQPGGSNPGSVLPPGTNPGGGFNPSTNPGIGNNPGVGNNPGNNVLPPTNPNPANQPVTGKLGISINDFNDPEVVGKEIRYSVRFKNNSNQINRRVQVAIRVSEGVELLQVSSDGTPVAIRGRGADGSILLPTLEVFRVGEEMSYTIYLRSKIPQVMRVQASIISDLFPVPETVTETTTITPAG